MKPRRRTWHGWIRASRGLLIAVLCAGVSQAYASRAAATAVGFEKISVPYDDEPALTGGVWYPASSRDAATRQTPRVEGDDLPLVVISHGGGGSYDGHEDTALALARAGFVVAAVSHSGDTYDDESRVLELRRRPAQLQRLITFMLSAWRSHDRLDPRRVGAFGFSNGGFTVLVAAGGAPDLDRTERYCSSHREHDLCRALSKADVSPRLGSRVGGGEWAHDPRIRAIAAAAPAFGFAFGKDGLRGIRIPVQLWGGVLDRHQPPPWYEDAVADDLPVAPEFHRIPGAGHYDFLPPCNPTLRKIAPAICTSEPGFDRAVFHRELNAGVQAFFARHLAAEGAERRH
jgi:predicted dienelactone hydrolase